MLLDVLDILYVLGLDVDSKDGLVKAFVHTLQHLVVLGIHRADGEVFLNS